MVLVPRGAGRAATSRPTKGLPSLGEDPSDTQSHACPAPSVIRMTDEPRSADVLADLAEELWRQLAAAQGTTAQAEGFENRE